MSAELVAALIYALMMVAFLAFILEYCLGGQVKRMQNDPQHISMMTLGPQTHRVGDALCTVVTASIPPLGRALPPITTNNVRPIMTGRMLNPPVGISSDEVPAAPCCRGRDIPLFCKTIALQHALYHLAEWQKQNEKDVSHPDTPSNNASTASSSSHDQVCLPRPVATPPCTEESPLHIAMNESQPPMSPPHIATAVSQPPTPVNESSPPMTPPRLEVTAFPSETSSSPMVSPNVIKDNMTTTAYDDAGAFPPSAPPYPTSEASSPPSYGWVVASTSTGPLEPQVLVDPPPRRIKPPCIRKDRIKCQGCALTGGMDGIQKE